MAIRDAYPIYTQYKQPTQQRMRFTGAGASVPTPNANCPDALGATLTRSAAGVLSLATNQTTGWAQAYDAYVTQALGSTVGLKVCRCVAVDGVWPMTFAIQVQYSTNSANVDVTSSEELVFYLDASLSKP